ncbi:AAA ATPase-like protein [Fragilaria crotonensis]|nr:AAA ATPase-like protein [Fragilaria crotonensis]
MFSSRISLYSIRSVRQQHQKRPLLRQQSWMESQSIIPTRTNSSTRVFHSSALRTTSWFRNNFRDQILSATTTWSSSSSAYDTPLLEPLWLSPRKGTGFDHFNRKETKSGGDEKGSEDKGGDGSSGGSGGDNNNKNDFSWMAGMALGAVVAYMMINGTSALGDDASEYAREVTWSDLVQHLLDQGQVEKIVVEHNVARVLLKPGAPGLPRRTPGRDRDDSLTSSDTTSNAMRTTGTTRLVYRMAIGSVESLERKLDDAQRSLGIPPERHVPVQYSNHSTVTNEILAVIPSLILMGVLVAMLRGAAGGMGGAGRGGPGGIFQVGKSTAKRINKEDVSTTFNDVAGCQEAKKEIMEFVDFLQDPTRFTKLGAKIPKGALLCGPPGTGKTLLAKAVAGEAGVPFFSVSGSDFIEMFVGVGPARVRDLFKEARASAPCIVFIDEIDAVGRKRGRGGMGGNDERENTLNQLLVEMDGFSPSTGVVVLAGTNRIDILDSALTRPGRFDRTIQVDKPDLQGRKEIFMVHLKGLTLEEEAEQIAGRLAGLTPGFSGADIANICNEAAIVAARRVAESVSIKDFESAIDRVIGGMESNKIMSVEERTIVAHHEAGHAVAGWFLEHADPLLKVTIIPRSKGALGFAQFLPKEVFLRTHAQIMDKVCMALAGRAAEEIFFGRVTTGAKSDLRQVTDLVYSTIQIYGMNPRLGQLAFPKDPNAMFDERPYSDATAMAMDEEAKTVVDEAYQRTLNLLREKKDQVAQVAAMLLEKETITHDDILEVVGPRPFKGDKQYEEYIKRNEIVKKSEEVVEEEASEESGPLNPGLA